MHDQHIFLGVDSSATLAVVEYTHPYVEYRHPVSYALKREYEEPRFVLRELESLHASNTIVGAAEQIRSKLFKIARQNLDCTLVVDTTGVGQPLDELFHHLPARASIFPVMVTDGSGEVRVGEQYRIAKHGLFEGLKNALESAKVQVRVRRDVANESCAVALAVWRATEYHKGRPKSGLQEEAKTESPAKESGWGKVRLL